jgi:hypothetical protein
MGVLNKLSRLITGAAPTEKAVAALSECHRSAVTRSRQLAAHAEIAPQDQSAESLRELAVAEEQQVARLSAALCSSGAAVPPVPEAAPPAGALNHWARLVQDLEAHRRSMRRLRELSTRFAESLPSTAELFDDLCHEEAGHCERLRELIARADPQALD